MKRVALGALGLVLGCNQIFGLKQTQQIDGAVDGPPPVPQKTHLEWQIPQLKMNGQPDPMLVYAGIGIEASRPDQPMIQVGPELDTTGDAALSPALYDPTMGTFAVPDELLGRHWRMVYTLPGDPVPHEVQWTVSSAHLAIPRLTRLDAPAVPTNSGYQIMPVGGPSLFAPLIMTSGVWTWSAVDQWTANTFEFDYSHYGKPLAGPAGAPESTKGDWVLATDWGAPVAPDESSVVGWAWTDKLDLVAFVEQQPSPEPMWNAPPVTQLVVHTNVLNSCGRLMNRFQLFMPSPNYKNCVEQTLEYGLLPNALLPGFGPEGQPLILPLDIATSVKSPLTFVDVDSTVPLQHALYSKLVNSHSITASSVPIASSLEVVAADSTVLLDYPALIVVNPSIALGGGQALYLSEDNETFNVPPGTTNPVQVSFTFEININASADDVLVTLYTVTTSALIPVRTYLLPDPTMNLLIDPRIFQDNTDYVLSFVTHHGYPMALQGDYTKVSYPFGKTTTFSGKFHVTVQ